MTPKPPQNLAGLTREELTRVVRDLEQTCNMQDEAAQKASAENGRLYLENKKLREELDAIRRKL